MIRTLVAFAGLGVAIGGFLGDMAGAMLLGIALICFSIAVGR